MEDHPEGSHHPQNSSCPHRFSDTTCVTNCRHAFYLFSLWSGVWRRCVIGLSFIIAICVCPYQIPSPSTSCTALRAADCATPLSPLSSESAAPWPFSSFPSFLQ
ncbi:Hypothetical predicted protein [Cloeon dipterum]|uniref:Uncharacterized protein n=1 Tax=Cloeon dipterum TaxID=197152 RepID=A0A8S1DPF3_9INSE|nr:Hypothetical predicted protein [Cloeon dipterum]